ncbi:MAG: DUF732 domain-containing protein [Mycobacterium sp.]
MARSRVPGSPPTALLPTLLLALIGAVAAAVLLSGCGSDDDVMTTAKPPPGDNMQTGPGEPNLAATSGPDATKIVVTPEQRVYLDALAGAGVRRSTDLMALSIGSYVCQARAAGQSDQGVWDYVLPLVRGDVDDMNPDATPASMAPQVRDATTQYIRIATEQLCSGEHSHQ